MKTNLRYLLIGLMALLALALGACDSDSDGDNEPGGGDTTWECDADHDDWEVCTDGVVQWCHVLEGMEPHFHNGADCASMGLACVAIAEGQASCVDTASTCTDGEHRCGEDGTAEANTAFNCVNGNWAVEPCGTAYHCHDEETAAVCELAGGDECGGHGHLHDGACHCDVGYVVDEHDPTNCVPAEAPSFPEMACTTFQDDDHLESKAVTTTFADVFAPDFHADLAHPVEVTLPDNEVSYIHFPCPADGEYVVFVSQAGLLEGIMDRTENDLVLGGGVPNGMCEEAIPEHYHATLTYDGDGEDPVPYVLRFAAVDTTTVRFLVMKKDAE